MNLLCKGGKKFDKRGRNKAKMERFLKMECAKSRGVMENGGRYDAVTSGVLRRGERRKFFHPH